jgi:hypothetical protein
MKGQFASWLAGTSAAMALNLSIGLQASAEEVVDIELVLAVDVSLSMAPFELDIQRDGYAAALTSEAVIQAILDGAHGRIAITYVEWAGDTVQRVIVPWTVIASGEDAEDFARRLTARPAGSARRTSISGALTFAASLFDDNGFAGMKRVIDISGDGPNNQGEPVVDARDRAIAKGITINGLPLMTDGGLTSAFDIPDLDRYYADCVIGGPGAFVIPVNDWSQFPEAIRRKLVLELAGGPMRPAGEGFPVLPAQDEPGYDCLIGEKRWLERSWMWQQN